MQSRFMTLAFPAPSRASDYLSEARFPLIVFANRTHNLLLGESNNLCSVVEGETGVPQFPLVPRAALTSRFQSFETRRNCSLNQKP